MDRTEFLRSLIDTAGHGLEIGPSYNPLLPKSAGFDVRTADYTDAEGLRAKYLDNPHVDIAMIEPVDFVVTDRGLAGTVGERALFDYIVASHVIEHTPDMLGFLKDCEALLKPDGVLLLAVPDKRHCFDVLHPWSSTGAVLQAHLDGRRMPSPGAVWDDRAYNAVRGGAIGWSIGGQDPLRFFIDLPDALRALAKDTADGGYVDVHVWRFLPSSFRLIVNDLHALGEIALREQAFHDSVGNEFYVTMSRSGAGPDVDRLTLALRTLSENATIPV
ncbi:methyltransferase domain-containing protein [Roseomonas sp. CECT 9278]|uniref:methyltransferase domain-containing protein n=1 Tax=Roseomonas sp. CECT 9278 TaxID=2845823 RepID=UPI001E3AF873|nr:methyltransferase domain-containing protein [Roseomonas sp. CECT 9278]